MRRGRAAGHIVFALVAGLLLGVVARAEEDEPDPLPDDRPDVTIEVKPDSSVYADTGRLTMNFVIRAAGPLPMRCRVLLQLVRPGSGDLLIDVSHIPATRSTRWEKDVPVDYAISTVLPAEKDGSRPALEILVGLVDPTRENGFEGRLILEGNDRFGDRRYLAASVDRAVPVVRTVEGLLATATSLEAAGRGAEAFHVREEAMALADDLPGKLLVTEALLAQKPFRPDPVTAPEQTRMERMIAAEKLRYLRDRASALLREKELKLALRVMERIGGVAEEERNTRVAGELGNVKRAQKDIVDLRARILALPRKLNAEAGRLIDEAEGDPKKLLTAAKKLRKRGSLRLARTLLREITLGSKHPDKLKDEARKQISAIEKSLLEDLTPAQERRLAKEMDHPAFHRLASSVSGRFVFLGPKDLVETIPVESRHRFDVASLLLTDLLGRSATAPGERVIVFYKETWDFGGATAGGDVINVGRANPGARGSRVDTSLFYHEFTHCVDDTRPVHTHKGGLTEGIANVGSIFVRDMFAGREGRFEGLAKGSREALRRYYLDRREGFWLIPGYAPSAGFLLELLARHAPAPGDHADWTRLGRFFREYRILQAKSRRTHRIMAHLGLAFERALGPEVWATLSEMRFPVDRNTAREMAAQYERWEGMLRALARRRNVSGLLALAVRTEPDFMAARARFNALAILDHAKQADGATAVALRKALGVIEDFHVIGPFHGKTGEPLAEIFPPETELDWAAEYLTGGDVARWQVPARGADHYAKQDGLGRVLLMYGYPANVVSYAVAHVTVPDAMNALAWITADDEPALWVNGDAIQRIRGRRPLQPDYERWPIRLRAGRNRVFLKIRNHDGRTGFGLRITDPDGRAIESLTTDLDPARAEAADAAPKWKTLFEDNYRRRSLGRKYEIAAGSFRMRNKVLQGEKSGRGAGWRPFAVRPGFPQDTPAALFWLTPQKDMPEDFRWRIRLEKERVPKVVLTFDGEGDRETLSGWSVILLPAKDGKTFQARLERYDIPQAVCRVKTPETWADRMLVVQRVRGRVTVVLGGVPVFTDVSAPPLERRRLGCAVWGAEPGLTGMTLSVPR